MSVSRSWGIYGLVSGFNAGARGKLFAPDQFKAVEWFCRLHSLHPEQVAVLYWFPLNHN